MKINSICIFEPGIQQKNNGVKNRGSGDSGTLSCLRRNGTIYLLNQKPL